MRSPARVRGLRRRFVPRRRPAAGHLSRVERARFRAHPAPSWHLPAAGSRQSQFRHIRPGRCNARGRPLERACWCLSRRPALALLSYPTSDQLELDHRRGVAWAGAELDDPGVARVAVRVLWSDLVDQLVDDEWLIRQLGDDPPARRKRAVLGKGYDLLDLTANFLG